MKPRLFFPLVLVVLAAVVAGYWLASSGDRADLPRPVKESAPEVATQPAPLPVEPTPVAPPPPMPPVEPPAPPPASQPKEPGSVQMLTTKPQPDPQDQEAPRQEVQSIALNIRQYMLRFGGNPVGNNAEIVAELNGGNSKGARYLPSELMRLNGQGELIDEWGTPYFFHQESANRMEVRSAGPDKKLFTADDYVAH